MKKKLFIVSFIILLIGFIYLLFDNATLLSQQKTNDKISERYFAVTDCINDIEQFELSDGTIAVEVLDIKDCVDKVKESLD